MSRIIILAALLIFWLVPPASAADKGNPPVAHWRFDEPYDLQRFSNGANGAGGTDDYVRKSQITNHKLQTITNDQNYNDRNSGFGHLVICNLDLFVICNLFIGI